MSDSSVGLNEKTDVEVNPVRRNMPFHQIQFLDSVIQIFDNDIYPIVRLDERVDVRLRKH